MTAATAGVRARANRMAVPLALVLALLGACSSDAAGPTTSTGAPMSSATTLPVLSTTSVAPATTATSPPQSIAPAMTAPPSPTGVPGIDATDQFCAAWARYGGTVQIVAVAVNFGELDSIASARLELESAPTVVEAVAEIGANWPSELAAERDIALDRYLGPYARRAEKAVQALDGAGIDGASRQQLTVAWATVLATRNPDEPTVTVDLPADLAAKVDAGATAFDAAVTPWGSDPSLTANLDDIPLTKAYLATHCPDLASIGIGDDV